MPFPALSPNQAAHSVLDDSRYLALCTRDARFDGRFFTAVTSTGIYCRPVCAVRTPRRENCRFFTLAAQAESAGFRPCLRCRPEVAPQALAWSLQDATGILVHQAVRLLDVPDAWAFGAASHLPTDGADTGITVARLAARLGVSDRHLRRIFEAALGVSPLQYLQTRRLLSAKQLLTDTAMPMTQVAWASGFASVRRFNAAFMEHYGLNPTQLRRSGALPGAGQPATLRLGYRPPFDVAALLVFFARRQLDGVEWVGENEPLVVRRTVSIRMAGPDGFQEHAGWFSAQFDTLRHEVRLQTSDSLYPVLPLVIGRVRALLDLDADPAAINAVLHAHFPKGDGLRVPGAFDGFELAVRAVLGQQITVAAARTLAQRLVERFGAPIATPWPELHKLFPASSALAMAEGEALGQLGIVRQRQTAIVALARAVESGQLALHGGADVPSTIKALTALPGIGDWTAQYIAMRVLRWPDAFPAADVALHKALDVQGQRNPSRTAEQASAAWRPWRSYAVVRAWSAGASALPTPSGDAIRKLSKP